MSVAGSKDAARDVEPRLRPRVRWPLAINAVYHRAIGVLLAAAAAVLVALALRPS